MMNIVVIIKLVPDLVEEISIDDSGLDIDRDWLRLIINELDDHALEQAILLKEKGGAQVTAITTDVEGADDILFAAAARGVDRLIKLTGDFEKAVSNHDLVQAFHEVITDINPDLILTGVQAHDDLDGSLGPLLAGSEGLPYIGYVSGISINNGGVLVRKEFPGGLVAEMTVKLPAVIGVQSAEQPPRYVAISKIRQAMQSATINQSMVGAMTSDGEPVVSRMYLPEPEGRATMILGDEEEVASRLIEIFQEIGVL